MEYQQKISNCFLRLKEKMICPICCQLLQNPVITPCNHIFCNFCITENLKSWQPLCPLCKRKTNKRSLKTLDFLNTISNKLSDLHSSIDYLSDTDTKLFQTSEINQDHELNNDPKIVDIKKVEVQHASLKLKIKKKNKEIIVEPIFPKPIEQAEDPTSEESTSTNENNSEQFEQEIEILDPTINTNNSRVLLNRPQIENINQTSFEILPSNSHVSNCSSNTSINGPKIDKSNLIKRVSVVLNKLPNKKISNKETSKNNDRKFLNINTPKTDEEEILNLEASKKKDTKILNMETNKTKEGKILKLKHSKKKDKKNLNLETTKKNEGKILKMKAHKKKLNLETTKKNEEIILNSDVSKKNEAKIVNMEIFEKNEEIIFNSEASKKNEAEIYERNEDIIFNSETSKKNEAEICEINEEIISNLETSKKNEVEICEINEEIISNSETSKKNEVEICEINEEIISNSETSKKNEVEICEINEEIISNSETSKKNEVEICEINEEIISNSVASKKNEIEICEINEEIISNSEASKKNEVEICEINEEFISNSQASKKNESKILNMEIYKKNEAKILNIVTHKKNERNILPIDGGRKINCPMFKFGSLFKSNSTRKKVAFFKKGPLIDKFKDCDLIECPKCHYCFSNSLNPRPSNRDSSQNINPTEHAATSSCFLDKSSELDIIKNNKEAANLLKCDQINLRNIKLRNLRKNNSTQSKKNYLTDITDEKQMHNPSTLNENELLNKSIDERDSSENKTLSENSMKTLKRKLEDENLLLDNMTNSNESHQSKKIRLLKNKQELNEKNSMGTKQNISNTEIIQKDSLALESPQDTILPCSISTPYINGTSMAARNKQLAATTLTEETSSSTCTIYPPTIQSPNLFQIQPRSPQKNETNLNESQEIILNSQLSQISSETSEILIPIIRKAQHDFANWKNNHNIENIYENLHNLQQNSPQDTPKLEDIFRNSKKNTSQVLYLMNEDTPLENQSALTHFLLIEIEDVEQPSNSQELIEATPPQLEEKKPKISKTPKLLTSGLDENERQQISKFIDVFDLSHFNDYNPEITHLIINNNPSGSTLKFLEALADGKWVVNLDWVIKSLESGQILPEEDFESINPNGEQGPMRARVRKNVLFSNFEIYLHGEITFISKETLRSLLIRVGCTVLDDPNNFSPQNIRHGLIVVQEKKYPITECQDLFKKYKRLIVDHFWPIECISDYRLRPIWPHLQMEETLEYLQLGYPQAIMEFDMLFSESQNLESAGN